MLSKEHHTNRFIGLQIGVEPLGDLIIRIIMNHKVLDGAQCFFSMIFLH